jgi:hypothetical protein
MKTKKKRLVFCVDCFFYQCLGNIHHCSHVKCCETKITPIEIKIVRYGDCFEINKNNDCKYYEKSGGYDI